MAKHLVKCLYCSQQFDTNSEEYVQIKRRYAHKKCAEEFENNKSKEEKDKEALVEYIKELLNIPALTPKINRQIKDYVENYNYSYSGILKALKYFYEIKHNDISKANEGIGIVGYIYNQAFNYYYDIWLAQQRNENKDIEHYRPNVIEISIHEPERKIKKRKLFQFLDLEE